MAIFIFFKLMYIHNVYQLQCEHFFITLSNLTYISMIYNSLNRLFQNPIMPKLKITPPCVYAIGFRRSTMLEYIYNGHSIAYDPISRVRKRD